MQAAEDASRMAARAPTRGAPPATRAGETPGLLVVRRPGPAAAGRGGGGQACGQASSSREGRGNGKGKRQPKAKAGPKSNKEKGLALPFI